MHVHSSPDVRTGEVVYTQEHTVLAYMSVYIGPRTGILL